MCDVNLEKLSAEEEMKRKTKAKDMSVCMKCKIEKPVVIIRINDPMCRSCFLSYATHKFRSTLGKSKLVKANDKVLIAVSGGHTSIAMLHLVKEALSEGAHKRLKFSPGVVFIDESVILNQNVEAAMKQLSQDIGTYQYPFYLIPLFKNIEKATENDEKNEQEIFKENYDKIKTLTAQTNFVEMLKLQLIVHTAKEHGYNKVMVGENSTTLSMKMLCNISQGRGISLHQDIAVGDDRFSDVMIIRPMREFSSKEAAMYNRLLDLKHYSIPNLHTMKESRSSLQRQTEEFITGLQAEFPSTVSTVFRTGDKLSSDSGVKSSDLTCIFCQSGITSDDIDVKVTKIFVEKDSGCCGSSQECTSNKFKLAVEDVKTRLCYGCNLTFKDMNNDVATLPSFLLNAISSDVKRSKMKESIQEFLLE